MSVIDLAANPSDLRALAEQSNAWPFEQAKAIVARLKKSPKDEVLFETGYGPSGLPHIGTFGEVARTSMVRHAFHVLTENKIRTRLLAFSDDMDGFRKVPDNVPNKEMLAAHLGKPLTRVPDPFSNEYPSFGHHNNARLRAFLDHFGFDYEFASSTDYYTSGRFDATLLKMLAAYDKVMAIILPTLGPDRRATYSPFLPISKITGVVLQVPMIRRDVAAGTVTYVDPDTSQEVETPVTGGNVKCQWKADWAMRWVALGVDYEMAGKDLIDSVKLSGAIARALGATPPEGFNYELFLDDKGQKISKSKGNGLTIDEWLRYASPESLSLFMYREPKAAKRLYFDVIPRNVDDYQQFIDGFAKQDAKQQLGNPVWHVHSGNPPKFDMPVTFQLLLTLVSSSNAENAETLWGFIGRYRPGVSPADASQARCDGRLCHQLLSRLRGADEDVPRTDRDRARSAPGSARRAVAAFPGRNAGGHPERRLRDRPPRSLPRPGQEGQGRSSGRDTRLVQHALPGAARPGKGPALRLLCRGLWRAERDEHDRRRAGAECVRVSNLLFA
ncbi:lysyl-tRNA synthetase class 1 [Bradyrhizobium sp. LM6.9]